MKKGKLIGRILGIALVGVMIGAMPGVLASIGSASEEVITVEDTDPGFSKYGTASYWWEDWVGGDHMYYTYNGYNTVDNYAKWTPSLPSAGTYPVYVWIPANHATTTNAIYTIHHNGQDDTRYVRQSDHSYWILLGYFYFSASGNEYVKLVDMTYESSASKQVGFDAVRWVKREFDLPQYVNGIDVSHWQGTINWVQVYNAGFRFAFAKATQGTGILDVNFMTNMNNGRNAGMFMGAYHYATPDSSTAADQANYFVDQAGEYITAGYLRPALDLEETGGLGQAVLSQWVNNFMSTVKSRTGVEPILYTSPSFANDNLDGTVVNEYDLWIAHWRTDLNPSTGGWDHWDFWQHTIGAKGSVLGINAEIDWDRFNGDISKLQQDFVIGQPPVYPKPTISASEYQTEIDVGETDWVKFTLRNDGTEYTDWWGIQVRVGDGLELVEHSSYPWSQGNMCNGKAAEWYKENDLGVGASDYIIVGIKGKTVSNYESVWYTAWMHDPDEQPEWIQYSHPVKSVPCDRDYAEYGVEVTPADYDEYFWSVTPYTYDSDSDGFNDSVTLEMDVDTTGDYVDVTVIGDLYDLNGTWVDEDSATWNIYGAAIEYGYLDLTNYGSIAGDCTYYLDLYDENGNYEDDWVGSVYLYPVGYVAQPPEVTTHPATDVTSTSATLHGYLDSLGDYNRVACTPEPPEFSLTKDYCVPTEATISVEAAIGDRYVEYWEHVTDGGICVKNDYVLIHRDIDSNEIINYEKNWREVEFTSGPIAPFEPPGGEYFWKRAVAFLDSGDCGYFYTMSELQEYPLVCWEVRYTDGTTTMYDLDGNEIGCGIPAPSKGFSLSGYYDSSLPDGWINWRLNADEWFQEWNLSTASLPLPTPTIISSYVSDPDYQFYYALAHGGSWYFQADNEGSYYYGSDAADDMENRPPMIFAFLGHCEGMTDIEPGTFSYEFRKGSMVDTVTVGYSGMSDCPGWSDSLEWQDYMFQKMDEGYTMRDAFDLASAQYPLIADCVVFVGDPDLTVPPIYVSFEWWTDPANKSETFSQPMDATGPFSESLTELTPGTTYYFQAKGVADGVTVHGDVLSFLTPATRTITFYTDPIAGGTITFNGPTYSDGQSTTVTDDNYPVSANPASNHEFDHWTTTGGVSVSSPDSQSTTATVSGDGSIKAWFNYIPPQRTITFYTDPTAGGTITFDGSTYSNGQSTTVTDDNYPVSANPASNYKFDHWTTTGGVSVSSPDSQSTSATVTGDGSMKAWFTITGEVNISLEPSTEHVGVGEVFDLIIQAEAGDQPVSGISAFIDFDPAYLEVIDADAGTGGIQITPGSTLPTVILNEADNSLGTIDYSAGKLGEPFPTGTFTVATIQFRALAPTNPSTALTFSTSLPRETRADYSGSDVTDTITGGTVFISEATVDISVVLQGGSRPPEGWEVPITIKFFSPGADVMTDAPIYEFGLTTTKSDGIATCQCAGVMPDNYDITAVSEHTLMNVKRDVVISGPSTAVDMGTLLEGNANDDSIINISDFGILAVSYMKTEGEAGYDARANFDRNGIINISDFGLLAVNYMKMSPIDVPG